MTRALIMACAVLAVLSGFQWRALRDLKADLATVDARAYRAALVDLHERRDEVLRTLIWLDTHSRAPEGLNRPEGLCRGGRPDFDAVNAWLFDVYLRERANGASEVQARALVLQRMTAAPAGREPAR
jgi:hypothetical protein